MKIFSSCCSEDDSEILNSYLHVILLASQKLPDLPLVQDVTLLLMYIIILFCVFNYLRFGPMVRSWCMRYEAKHSYFKRLASYMGNFTNVAL